MSNINTGSITGFSGLVPAHLQVGGGANSASRAVVQDTGGHGAQPAPMFDHKPAFQTAANDTTTLAASAHKIVQRYDQWVDGLFHHDRAPAV